MALRFEMFLFLALPMYVLGAIYAIPPGWNALDSYKTRILGKAPLRPEYYVVNNGSSDIVSNNGMFALFFESPHVLDSSEISLSLAVTSNNSWYSIITETYLEINEVITSIEVDDCGTTRLWQNNMTLRVLSSSILPLGPACAAITYTKITSWNERVYVPGGFTLVFNGTVWSLKKGYDLQHDSSSECPEGHRASLVLDKNGTVTLMYFKNSGIELTPRCMIPSTTLHFQKLNPEKISTLVLPFLKVTPTRELALYTLDTSQQTWVVDSLLMLDSVCKSGLACGPYNICDLKGECNSTLALGNTTDGPQDLLYAWKHSLKWSRRGVGYISTKYMDSENTSLESCDQKRSLASFYDHNMNRCYAMDVYPDGSLHRDENMTAFIHFSADKDFPRAVLSVGVVIVVIYSAFTIFSILFLPTVQRKLSYVRNPLKEVEALLSTLQGLPQRFSYMELEAATRGFASKLGAGGFGSVYEGFIGEDVRHVAVKKLDDNGTESAKQFVAELSGIGGVSHYNIVKLYGFCIEGASNKLLVYEFMPNGSLDRWLFGKDSEKILSWEQRFNIALGTARGLFYLSEPILHLDIKPQNILLDDKFEAKVADFGMAKMLANRDVTRVETNVRGTPGYMAPEWLLQYAATKKCDVYSYGMLLLELIGGRKNVDPVKLEDGVSSWYFPAWVVDRVRERNLVKVVDTRMKESASVDDVEMMVKIALWCIQENPVARPSMGDIMEMLQKHKKVEEPPMSWSF